MTYKETIFFIAKCLTISENIETKNFILKQINLKLVDWEKIVKISSSHLVFTTLYLKFKNEKILKFLPVELVDYMRNLNEINAKRNKNIISQAKEINTLLIRNNIKPVFIKGSGNLIAGFYDNNSERLVGDIDLICSKVDYQKAIKILKMNGYHKLQKDKYEYPPDFRHYSRLLKKNKIAAVEIHKELLINKYRKHLNFDSIIKNTKQINQLLIPSFEDQLIITITSNQINDNGFLLKNFNIKVIYDVFLLSKKVNFSKFYLENKAFYNIANSYIGFCSFILNNPTSLQYENNNFVEKYIYKVNSLLADNQKRKKFTIIKKRQILLKKRLLSIYKAFVSKKYRDWFLRNIKNKISKIH